MSAAATAAGYLYAAGRLGRRREPCGKNCYPTEGEALGQAVHRTRKGAPALRAYHCSACRAWHLTSRV